MKFRILKWSFHLLLVVAFSFVFWGCLGNTGNSSLPEDGTASAGIKSRKTTAVYYDFEDVLVPLELNVDKKRTVIISTPAFTSGILALKGRVDRSSLFNFFSNNMQQDNWDVLSQIKSPDTVIMVFQKASRTCVITIRDEQIYTYVEVGVAPTVNAGAAVSQPILPNPGMSEPGMSQTTLVE